jgi:hypothetical protein
MAVVVSFKKRGTLAARRRQQGLQDMVCQSPSRFLGRFGFGFPAHVLFRWRLGDSSTKVLYGTPRRPSTLVLHNAEPTQPGVS